MTKNENCQARPTTDAPSSSISITHTQHGTRPTRRMSSAHDRALRHAYRNAPLAEGALDDAAHLADRLGVLAATTGERDFACLATDGLALCQRIAAAIARHQDTYLLVRPDSLMRGTAW